MIRETVLACRPVRRARSARLTGCRTWMVCRMTSRLMARAVWLDATPRFGRAGLGFTCVSKYELRRPRPPVQDAQKLVGACRQNVTQRRATHTEHAIQCEGAGQHCDPQSSGRIEPFSLKLNC